VPITAGSTPALAQEAMRARGLRPRFLASSALISTRAAAPSLRPEALAAVTVPSLLKAGRRPETLSRVAPWRMYSSWSTTVSPLRPLMVTGAISSGEPPAFWAASALFWEATAKASWSPRVICQLGDVLGRLTHVVAVEGVPQAVLDHGVDQARSPILVPLRRCAACGAWLMLSWPPATTMLAEPSAICWAPSATARRPEPQSWLRLQAGALRDAGVDRGLAGRALAGGGLQHLAHDHLVDVARRDPGALDGRRMAIAPSWCAGRLASAR
jgi:hypothetical protein